MPTRETASHHRREGGGGVYGSCWLSVGGLEGLWWGRGHIWWEK